MVKHAVPLGAGAVATMVNQLNAGNALSAAGTGKSPVELVIARKGSDNKPGALRRRTHSELTKWQPLPLFLLLWCNPKHNIMPLVLLRFAHVLRFKPISGHPIILTV